jgi:peptidoglycan/xylan/chitin deacetylase (PgdA/CDA1 family)
MSKEVSNEIKAAIIQYDDESMDWEGIEASQVTDNIVSQIRNGSIVLMHDIQKVEIMALPNTIHQLKEQGYEFVTVDDIWRGFSLPYTQTDSVFEFGEVGNK